MTNGTRQLISTAATYTADDCPGKLACKRALQRRFGLPEIDVPLFGIVSRMVPQKGTDCWPRRSTI
jgi:Glycogen synthase